MNARHFAPDVTIQPLSEKSLPAVKVGPAPSAWQLETRPAETVRLSLRVGPVETYLTAPEAFTVAHALLAWTGGAA